MNWAGGVGFRLETLLCGGVEQGVGNRRLESRADIEAGMINLRGISYAMLWDWMRSPSCWIGRAGQGVHASSLGGCSRDTCACPPHWPWICIWAE